MFVTAAMGAHTLIPVTTALFTDAGINGIDLNKRTTERDPAGNLVRPIKGVKVPESMGLVCCTVYLIVIFLFIPISAAGDQANEHLRLSSLLSALLSICCMSLLGFADDVLNLRWRHKLLLPLVATLPVLMVYYTAGGGSSITLPPPLSHAVGINVVDIGWLYYMYMIMLSIFCTNAINILSGVNGLESGQALVIALSLLIFNVVQLARLPEGKPMEQNLFSLNLMGPFTGVALSLTYYNWFPAAVFVGDTWCYFAGMTFAVSAILSHNSKTLLLFFVPQVINFVYSVPQLFKIFPCPRHRMPGFCLGSRPDEDQVCMSLNVFDKKEIRYGALGKFVFSIFKTLRLAHLSQHPDGRVVMSNLTLNNLFLYLFGPMPEDRLCTRLLVFQVVCSVAAFGVRFMLAGAFYSIVK
eukprot:TRINITY_DN3457_c0_g1_i2.p1 TRINITY_DN3457_c0_g1~~TRINITY_DN3457_c0_g1_i2.p1  ORF type:complete len:411 (+),score=90.97 TRINITY_DN3457_c0_g1_i2:232-1464(+)